MVGIIGLHEVGGRGKSNSSFRFERVDFYISFILVAWIGWGYYQVRYLESTSPYLDALNAVLGLVAQFMLSRKILENWHLWILYNVVSIVIYISTGLYVMLILAIINLFICVAGLLEWKSNYKGKNIQIIISRK